MNNQTTIIECKSDNHSVRLKIKKGRILRCGYLMKCGEWHYATPSEEREHEYFNTGEPKNYMNTLNYVIDVIYYYDNEKFESLLVMINEKENIFHMHANIIKHLWDNNKHSKNFEKENFDFSSNASKVS